MTIFSVGQGGPEFSEGQRGHFFLAAFGCNWAQFRHFPASVIMLLCFYLMEGPLIYMPSISSTPQIINEPKGVIPNIYSTRNVTYLAIDVSANPKLSHTVTSGNHGYTSVLVTVVS